MVYQSALPPKDAPAPLRREPIAAGKFVGTLDSLKSNRFPRWFTEGKLGIWAHWGPQAVPMEGDWYARRMYEEGSSGYKDHVARFGHPSEKGYKDIIPMWKAERWDPERLMRLYRAAGAKYFVSMAAHHDNFDLWNSTHHRWNAVKMGPKRDVVGEWQRAAKRNGMRFGVSEHLGASWTWFQASRGADKTGPKAGVPYDGNDPAYDDLYHPKALPGDTGWYTTDPRWHREWYRRVKDVVDLYKPDLLYTDGPLPFGDYGASVVAHLYNINPQSVYACKQPGEGRWAQDVERGVLAGIAPYPWQIDTSIGDWYYNRNWKYRGADWVVRTLVDVVSKNGNLLINVVQRPDGSLDPEAEQVLADMAAWMKVNGESVYGTRPWLVFGEGPTRAKGGAFREDFGFSAKDIRYTRKGDGTVYATIMGTPTERELMLTALGKREGDKGTVRAVTVLGSQAKPAWTQSADGLRITLPEGPRSEIATVLKITGSRLDAFYGIPAQPGAAPMPTVRESAPGTYELKADGATLPESGAQVEEKNGVANIGFWDNPADKVSWKVDFREAGMYEVVATVAAQNAGSAIQVTVGSSSTAGRAESTGAWDKFVEVPLGRIAVANAGTATVVVGAADAATWHAINLRGLTFRKR